LWAELFNESTFVRYYEYSDYSKRGIISYSVRDTLSAIKTVYQEAAVELAIPGDVAETQEERGKASTCTGTVVRPRNGGRPSAT